MTEPSGNGKKFVTTTQLAAELKSFRWEVRFLVVVGTVASGLISRQVDLGVNALMTVVNVGLWPL